MRIEEFIETIKACRFCFMCRHLSPVGNVTFKEADTPRARALIADRMLRDKASLADADYIKTIYDAELSAANRQHCVSHYDESGLLRAARADIVDAGLAPENVKALAVDLAKATFKIEGKGDILYHPGTDGDAGAFQRLAGKCQVIKGGDIGAGLEALGYVREAEKAFARFKAAVKSSKCKKNRQLMSRQLPLHERAP